MASTAPVTIKKYGNRRLYDTQDSRYVTLEELAAKVRSGTDVRVVDAKTGADLTQATLTQIIIEGRGAAKLLPVPLLTQLIRLSDDALAEFFGRYVSGALELYQQMRRGAQSVAPYNPLASIPFTATDALARMWMGNPFGAAAGFGGGPAWTGEADRTPPPEVTPVPEVPRRPETEPPAEPEPPRETSSPEVAELRRELEELKRSVGEQRRESAPAPRRRPRRSAGRKR